MTKQDTIIPLTARSVRSKADPAWPNRTNDPHGSSYVLRYFLPYPPYVEQEVAERRLEELVEFCKRTRVDAVMFYCNLLTDWYYMPDTLEHSLQVAESMKAVSKHMKEAGLSFQLNLQNFIGALTGHTDLRPLYEWECMVDHRGNEVKGVACPLGKKFRQKMGQQLAAWAATEPEVLWIDDDLRLHNHLDDGYLDFYCFCPYHLKEFGLMMGEEFTFEALVAEVQKPGQPSELRKAWLEFMNWTVVDTAGWIEKQVHKVSPQTRIAQMTSIPDVHAVEGRNWGSFLRALSGDKPAILRPHFGPYTETLPSEFVDSYLLVDQLMKNVEMQHGPEVGYFPELENTRFTTWAKSAAATRYQLRLGQLLGCKGITLSLYDLEGSALSEEPAYERLLTEEKPALDSLARLNLQEWTKRGIALITDPLLGHKTQIDINSNTQDLGQLLGPGRTFDRLFMQLGVPAHYVSPQEARQQQLVALDGTSAWLLDDESLVQVLSGAVLLDSNAAAVIIKRGQGGLIGIENVQARHFSTSAEVFLGDVLPGLEPARTPLRMKKGMWKKLHGQKNALVLTEIVDPRGVRTPGTICYENARGGRIATYAGCVNLGPEFFSHRRVQWLNALIEWLGRETFPVIPTASQRCLMIRRDAPGMVLLAVANLSPDVMKDVSCRVRLDGEFKQGSFLSRAGGWEPLKANCLKRIGEGEYLFEASPALQIYDWFITILKTESVTGDKSMFPQTAGGHQ